METSFINMRPVNLYRNTILKILEAQKDYKYRIEKKAMNLKFGIIDAVEGSRMVCGGESIRRMNVKGYGCYQP